MTAWLLRRLVAACVTLLAVVTVAFVAIHLAPGTPFLPEEGRPVNPAAVARLRAEFGLDRPLPEQYVRYLGALARGRLGESFSQRRPVADAIATALPNTLVLAIAALAIDFLLGIAIGAAQAARAGSRTDVLLTNTTLFLYSLPVFWLGLLVLLVFGQWLRWFPIGGVTDPVVYDALSVGGRLLDRLHHLALPALTLGLVGAAGTARYQRAAMLDTLRHEHVRSARARGLTEPAVLRRHVLRNALLPAISLLGLALPFLLTGAVLVETVFAWPGLGKLAADAVAARDYPLVLATTLLATAAVLAGSLVADVLAALADPRIRLAT